MLTSNIQNYNRFQASGLHFLLSLGILIILLGLMAGLWFPGETFLYDGGLQGLKILIPVDLVLGPILTLVVFDGKKKSLKIDLSIIALIQLLALSWGVHQIYSIRSQFIVYYDNTFTSVTKGDLLLYQTTVKNRNLEDVKLPLKSWHDKTNIVTLKATTNEKEEATRRQRIELGRTFGTGGPIYNHELYTKLKGNELSSTNTYTGFFRYFETHVQFNTVNHKLHSLQTKTETSWVDLLLAE